MITEPNLLNRIIITIDINNTQAAKKILHNSLLNQSSIKELFDSYFSQYVVNQTIYLKTLTLNLGEIRLNDFNSLFIIRLNENLNKTLSQYQANNQTDIEKFIYYLYRKDSILNPIEDVNNHKITDINIKQLINQLPRIQNNWTLLLAKSCLSAHSLQKLLAIKEPALLTAINRKLSEKINISSYQQKSASSWQLILNALKYIHRHHIQEIPEPDAKVISHITIELNDNAINTAPIVALFRQVITDNSSLNTWLEQLWQTKLISQLCKKQLSIAEYQHLSERFIAKHRDNNKSGNKSSMTSELDLLPEHPPPRQVNNAGILVLWPMLPTLFNQLGLFEKQKFIHRQAQFRAVDLLDYLIWGNEEAQTERKILNCVLCGLIADENTESTPIEPEKQRITEQWLDTIISQLPAWKKLSRNDTRQLFLQRPGELLTNEQEIKITIQPQPFDALLNDWPWPLNIAKLPWLDRPLLINW